MVRYNERYSDWWETDESGKIWPVTNPRAEGIGRGSKAWRIGDTQIAGRVRVSTVFLGLDHNFSDTGPPILWETMIFGLPGEEACSEYQERYASKADAIAGHARAIKYAQKRIPLWWRLRAWMAGSKRIPNKFSRRT